MEKRAKVKAAVIKADRNRTTRIAKAMLGKTLNVKMAKAVRRVARAIEDRAARSVDFAAEALQTQGFLNV